jgi:hypothetical protein
MQSSGPASSEPVIRDSIDDLLSLTLVRDEAKQEILDCLETVRGRKCLFVDSHLHSLLNEVFAGDTVKILKDNGVQYYRNLETDISEFANEMSRDSPENVIYLIRSYLPNMKEIASQIKAIMQMGIRCQFRIFFVPCQSTICLHLLEEQISDSDMWEKISFKECRLGLVPLDSDVLSLEMDYVFKQVSDLPTSGVFCCNVSNSRLSTSVVSFSSLP